MAGRTYFSLGHGWLVVLLLAAGSIGRGAKPVQITHFGVGTLPLFIWVGTLKGRLLELSLNQRACRVERRPARFSASRPLLFLFCGVREGILITQPSYLSSHEAEPV